MAEKKPSPPKGGKKVKRVDEKMHQEGVKRRAIKASETEAEKKKKKADGTN